MNTRVALCALVCSSVETAVASIPLIFLSVLYIAALDALSYGLTGEDTIAASPFTYSVCKLSLYKFTFVLRSAANTAFVRSLIMSAEVYVLPYNVLLLILVNVFGLIK